MKKKARGKAVKVAIKPIESDRKDAGFSKATGMKPPKKRGTL